jgi:hypothetical protein
MRLTAVSHSKKHQMKLTMKTRSLRTGLGIATGSAILLDGSSTNVALSSSALRQTECPD